MAENDNTAMDFVMDLLTEIAVEYDVGVDVPHQIAKGKGEAGNADAGRGASAIKGGGRLANVGGGSQRLRHRQMRALRPHRKVSLVPRGGKPPMVRAGRGRAWQHVGASQLPGGRRTSVDLSVGTAAAPGSTQQADHR